MKLQPSPKSIGQRAVAPRETIQLLEGLLSRFDYQLYEEQVGSALFWAVLYIDDLSFRAMGKGTTPEASKAGALAEAAEWLLCRDHVDVPGYVYAHQDELETDRVLGFDELLPHVSTATPPVIDQIKNLDASRHWLPAWSLQDACEKMIPIEYLHIIGGPNGQAAGNTLTEAVEHAVLEIFERRAHITILRNRMVVPTINLASIQDEQVQSIIAWIQKKGIEVTIKDLSFGGVLPCIGAYFVDPAVPEEYQFHHFFKVGAAFNTVEAITRTCTEFVQGRMKHEFLCDGKIELQQLLEPDFRGLRSPAGLCDNFLSAFMFGFAVWRDASFLYEGDVVPATLSAGFSDSLDDVLAARDICKTLGKDLLVTDLSDPESGFHIARVTVPSYSDVLPFHPANSPGLFRKLTRSEVLAEKSYRESGSC